MGRPLDSLFPNLSRDKLALEPTLASSVGLDRMSVRQEKIEIEALEERADAGWFLASIVFSLRTNPMLETSMDIP